MIFRDLFRKKHLNCRAILIGDSITEEWHRDNPDFFGKNQLISKGISGDTTLQMLKRFDRDAVEHNPEWIIIFGGTNDIANDLSNDIVSKIVNNLTKMAEKATANNIKVAICSVLPASLYPWSPNATPSSTIPQLNVEIMNLCQKHDYTYINLFDEVRQPDSNGLLKQFTYDEVHCTSAAYRKMEPVLLGAINP